MGTVPLVARHICALLEAQWANAAAGTGEGADLAPGTATAALLSFRVLTPMLVTPSAHGLTAVRPTATTRRALMLASKVLHAAAVGLRFAEKEPFLTEVNDYIERTAPRWQRVWAQAAAPLAQSPYAESSAGAARAEREVVELLSTGTRPCPLPWDRRGGGACLTPPHPPQATTPCGSTPSLCAAAWCGMRTTSTTCSPPAPRRGSTLTPPSMTWWPCRTPTPRPERRAGWVAVLTTVRAPAPRAGAAAEPGGRRGRERPVLCPGAPSSA